MDRVDLGYLPLNMFTIHCFPLSQIQGPFKFISFLKNALFLHASKQTWTLSEEIKK